MGSPPRTRRFYRPLLEDLRRIAMAWKQRCGSSLAFLAHTPAAAEGHPSYEWTIESPVRRNVSLKNGKLSVDGTIVLELRPVLLDIEPTYEIEIDGTPYTLFVLAEGCSCSFLRSRTPEAKSKRLARRRRIVSNTALSFAAGVCCLILASVLPWASTIGCGMAAFCFFAIGCNYLAAWSKRSGRSRPANSTVRKRVETPSKRLDLGCSVALLAEVAFSLTLSMFLFACAYDTTPEVMFLSVVGAVACFSVAIGCGVLCFHLLGWRPRVPDASSREKTTEESRPPSRAVCRHLLEDIHRTAAAR